MTTRQPALLGISVSGQDPWPTVVWYTAGPGKAARDEMRAENRPVPKDGGYQFAEGTATYTGIYRKDRR